MVWILIPKEKKDEIDWNKDLLEKFKNCEDLVEVSNHFIQEGGFLMDRREDLDGVWKLSRNRKNKRKDLNRLIERYINPSRYNILYEKDKK
jgi:hypothetical protein